MRSKLLLLVAILFAWTAAPVIHAYAQEGGSDQDDQDAKKKKRDEEWNLRQAPLPGKRNAGPCPYVKVLYDAARYEEFNGEEASSNVAYTGEIEGVTANCTYRGSDPIKTSLRVLFSLGRGPKGAESRKSYTYWVAVTHRNREVLAKEFFTLPVSFPSGKDRVSMSDEIKSIVIPRADQSVSGENFEILVGFEVTPEMADFNRQGKRFRINAGAPVAGGAGGGR